MIAIYIYKGKENNVSLVS